MRPKDHLPVHDIGRFKVFYQAGFLDLKSPLMNVAQFVKSAWFAGSELQNEYSPPAALFKMQP